jgi:hypothetical protein
MTIYRNVAHVRQQRYHLSIDVRRFRTVQIDFQPMRKEDTNNNNNNSEEEKNPRNILHVSEHPRFLVRGSHMRSTIRKKPVLQFKNKFFM